MEKYYCAVCENEITLDDCYNCFVCEWDSDPAQENDPDYCGGANKCSLNEARAAWRERDKASTDVHDQVPTAV